ncbi:MAG: hypothetical protein QOE26_2758 [Verrucomicrobiota bacterium]|jgi:hypothetical protein
MKTDRARLYRWQIARGNEVDESFRERAFLPITDQINGVTVLQFTLRHLTILSHLQSPFIYGGVRQMEDIGQFLWVVSPQYDTLPPEETNRTRYLAELVLHPKWENFYRAIDRYLQRTFRDPPPMVGDGKLIAACYTAGVVHKIAKTYGWDDETIMDKPLIRLFQYLKWIQADENPATPQFSPMADRVKSRFS